MMLDKIRRVRDRFLKYYKYNTFLDGGMIPWTKGYNEYKWDHINQTIYNIKQFKKLPSNYGFRIDERIVEYPWLFSSLNDKRSRMLDAGSVLNHKIILDHPSIKSKDLTICTLYPEESCYVNHKISYVFSDLRDTPFRDNYFDLIACISTIEHIDMDNSIYGAGKTSSSSKKGKSYEYLKAVKEMIRILKRNGNLYITAPFGKYENHGFFQQFDLDMISQLEALLEKNGKIINVDFFKYKAEGWVKSDKLSCKDQKSFNPHTGVGSGADYAAHCRSVFCINFKKNS